MFSTSLLDSFRSDFHESGENHLRYYQSYCTPIVTYIFAKLPLGYWTNIIWYLHANVSLPPDRRVLYESFSCGAWLKG